MEMLEISPLVLLWTMGLANWLGVCSAYFHADANKAFAKIMGIVLLLTGILMFGIWVGGRR